jgi:hypothetical protein
MSKLTKDDYLSFLGLKIPREIVDRAKIFRVHRDEAELVYGIKLDCDGGLAYPYFLPPLNGNQTTRAVYHRVRQDRPPRDASGKEERKYLAPQGRTYPYFAPVDPAWYQDPSVPVILVESAKSALSILRWCEDNRRRYIPVAMNGCYGWSGKVGIAPDETGKREDVKDILPLLESVCRGRRVYILVDQNDNSNYKVRDGRDKLARRLLDDITADVRVLHLPPAIREPFYNGPDDFLAAFDDEAFFDLFETAEVKSRQVESVSEATPALLEIEDLPETCLDGRLGEICTRYLGAFPRAYAYPALLANASVLIQDRAEGVRTNLYSVMVGKIHTGKSQAEKWAAGILGVGESSTISTFTGSGEQFVHLCADAAGSPRLFAPNELGHTLQKMAIERASFAFIFNRAWDEDKFPVSMAKHPKQSHSVFHCHLSILGGVVDDYFEDLFGVNTVAGFYDRCFFSYGPSGSEYDYRGAFPERLRGSEFRNPGRVEIDRSVWAQLSEWRKNDPSLGRILEISLRVATISAAFDHRDVLA